MLPMDIAGVARSVDGRVCSAPMRRTVVCCLAIGMLFACASESSSPPVAPASAAADDSAASASGHGEAVPQREASPAVAPPVEQPDVGADPAINQPWQSNEIDPLVGRLESESREIFEHRERLVAEVAPRAGSTVADVGAGSGFLTLLLANAVGPSGKVFAVDINLSLLEEVERRAKAAKIGHIETRVAEQDETPLDPNTVDLVFICDTYHHFEKPRATMASIFDALRPGGELVLVDFERIEGKTEPFMLEHVRAGKEVFRQEVLDVGFELVREHEAVFLEENYMLRFRKPAS